MNLKVTQVDSISIRLRYLVRSEMLITLRQMMPVKVSLFMQRTDRCSLLPNATVLKVRAAKSDVVHVRNSLAVANLQSPLMHINFRHWRRYTTGRIFLVYTGVTAG